MTEDERYMVMCLDLARCGMGRVHPNPMVGAVLVRDGRIISTGYHRRYGGPHAEIIALEAAKELAKGSHLYINLEPCCHFGHTPPCADAIIRYGIKRVVIGMRDPNPIVKGKGIAKLHEAGIIIKEGILGEACVDLNHSYIEFVTQNLPL